MEFLISGCQYLVEQESFESWHSLNLLFKFGCAVSKFWLSWNQWSGTVSWKVLVMTLLLSKEITFFKYSPTPYHDCVMSWPKRGHLGEGWQLQQLLHPALGCCSVFPGYFTISLLLAGRKWPAGCKMAIVTRFSPLCTKQGIMQDSVKRWASGFASCAFLFKT